MTFEDSCKALDNGDVLGASLYLAHASLAAYTKDSGGDFNVRSYDNSDGPERVAFPDLGLTWVRPLPSSGPAQGYMAYRGDNIVVAFRGTATLADWRSNLQVAHHELGDAQVHGGFLRLFRTLQDDLMAFVRSKRSEAKRRLWLTGHSLGGALAVLGGLVLATDADDYTPDGIVTFGAPRVGDDQFRLLYRLHQMARCTWQFANERDIVTQVPAQARGAVHVGGSAPAGGDAENFRRHIYLPDADASVRRRDLDELPDPNAFTPAFIRDDLLPFVRSATRGGEYAHAMRRYIARVAARVDGQPLA